jgi:hypothetical protein
MTSLSVIMKLVIEYYLLFGAWTLEFYFNCA